jgi:hypothetical protein
MVVVDSSVFAPKPVLKLFPCYDGTWLLKQRDQHLKGLALDPHPYARAAKLSAFDVYLEDTELVVGWRMYRVRFICLQCAVPPRILLSVLINELLPHSDPRLFR